VGVRAVALVLFLAALPASAAFAQRTTFEGLNSCQRYAAVEFGRRDPGFRRFIIERGSVVVEHFAGMVGNQYVSTIYRGRATYDAGIGSRTVRFICLHAGMGHGAVLVYALPD